MTETIFLHGWGLHGGVWSALRATWPESQAPDLPGYEAGSCAVQTVSPYTAESLAHAMAERWSDPVNLVGWSMGGMIALALAAQYPAKVAKLVLVGASPCFMNRTDWTEGLDANVLQAFSADLQADYRATLLRFLALQGRGGEAARAVVTRLREVLLTRPSPDANVLGAGLQLLRDVDLRSLAPRVSCPTLVVHGAHDTLCLPAAGQWLASTIPGAKLAMHAHASHAPFMSHPDWFSTHVKAFLYGE